jgi:hypothetical protein
MQLISCRQQAFKSLSSRAVFSSRFVAALQQMRSRQQCQLVCNAKEAPETLGQVATGQSRQRRFQLINQADNAAFGCIALSLLSVPHCGLLKRLIPQVSWSRH